MTDSKKITDYFFLTAKEEAAMKVLWNTNKPLSATEIAEGIPNRSWPTTSIQAILRSLEKKQAVTVAEITKLGKSYGRLFRPTLSANEYAAMQFKRYYQSDDTDHLALISSLLVENNSDEEIINSLQKLIDEYKEE